MLRHPFELQLARTDAGARLDEIRAQLEGLARVPAPVLRQAENSLHHFSLQQQFVSLS